ncbi:MAG: adenylate/guanylate cyclase domain-containing protein [Geminicoccaceae bacterium]
MVDDLARWLEKLDLGKYAEVLAQHEVSVRDLPHLTEDDLKELGLPLGPRRRLLAAAASDNMASASMQSRHRVEGDAPALAKATVHTAERRRLTVMFADLVGSTELSRRLDPEDLREVLRQYQDVVAGVVERYDGHIAKFLGDGVLAYFGWPQAHEDDAERAVRSGLETVAAVAGIDSAKGEQLQARVGIASGEVVVGDLGSGGRLDAAAVAGETPNLAARLQGAAEPDTVLLDAATRSLLGEVFEVRRYSDQMLKGFAEAVPVWRVLAERAVASRFEAAHGGGLTALVGREHEIGLLLDRWQLSCAGEGQVVLLSGPAGIGKSRILGTLSERIADREHFRLRYQCSPYHSNIAFHPVTRQLELAAGLNSSDGVADRLDKLERLLSLSAADVKAVAPLFATLMSLPAEDRYGPLNLSSQQLREQIIAALVEQLVRLARQRPVLMLLEDAHWIDPSTEALVGESISAIADAAVLILITHRPGYTTPWSAQSHLASLPLSHFSRAQSAQMVRSIAGDRFDAGMVERIVERASGIPLFVEELTKSLLESGGDGGAIDIPTTLQASLLARLDRLGEAKQIAQVGAVIGREFSHDLLAAVAGLDAGRLNDAVERLLRSELLSRTGSAAAPRYVFKHALIQDAAYDSLLRERRRELHARVAAALTAAGGDSGERAAEMATHLQRSGQDIEAAHAFTRAGDRARHLFANQEALTYFTVATDLWRAHPDEDRDGSHRLALGNRLAALLMLVGDYRRAESVSRDILDEVGAAAPPAARASMLSRLGRTLYMRGLSVQARIVYRQALELAETLRDDARLAAVYRDLGDVEFTSGTLPAAVDAYEKGRRISESISDHTGVAAAHTMLSNAFARAGDIDDAMRHAEIAVELGQRIGDERRVAWANVMLAQCRWSTIGTCNLAEAQKYIGEAQRIFARVGDYRGLAWVLYGESDSAFVNNNIDLAVAVSREQVSRAALSGGFQHEMTATMGNLALFLAEQGKFTEALEQGREALHKMEELSNNLQACETHAVVATILVSLGPRHLQEAQIHAEASQNIARRVGVKRVVGFGLLAEARIALARGDKQLACIRAEEARRIFEACRANWYLRKAQKFLDDIQIADS